MRLEYLIEQCRGRPVQLCRREIHEVARDPDKVHELLQLAASRDVEDEVAIVLPNGVVERQSDEDREREAYRRSQVVLAKQEREAADIARRLK